MKKSVNFGFIIALLLIASSFSVWASGVNDERRGSCDYARVLNEMKFMIGCECATYGSSGEPEIVTSTDPYYFDFFRTNYDVGSHGREEKYYCYVDDPLNQDYPGTGSGKGQIRMCTEDDKTEYAPDYSGGNERNKECSPSTPFCNEDKYTCNECRGDSDCSKTPFAQLNPGKLIQAKCAEQYGIETQTIKSCEYCVRINGTGSKKIVFVVGQLPPDTTQEEIIQSAYESIIGTEPFKYLYGEKNAFTFSYIPIHDTTNLFRDFNNRYDRFRDKAYLGESEKKIIEDKVNQICGDYSVIIYIDYFDGNLGGYANDKFVFISDTDAIIDHELGHTDLGKLGDEYALNTPRKLISNIETEGVNIQAGDSPTCDKFTNYGVGLPNCFEIFDSSNKGYKKSTLDSMMNDQSREPKFNVISCAGILNQVLGWDIKTQGVPYCSGKAFAPDKNGIPNYKISNGIIPQGKYAKGCMDKFYEFHNDAWNACSSNGFEWESCLNPTEVYGPRDWCTTVHTTQNEHLCYLSDLILNQYTFCPNECENGNCI